jgi:hypothetical protein
MMDQNSSSALLHRESQRHLPWLMPSKQQTRRFRAASMRFDNIQPPVASFQRLATSYLAFGISRSARCEESVWSLTSTSRQVISLGMDAARYPRRWYSRDIHAIRRVCMKQLMTGSSWYILAASIQALACESLHAEDAGIGWHCMHRECCITRPPCILHCVHRRCPRFILHVRAA